MIKSENPKKVLDDSDEWIYCAGCGVRIPEEEALGDSLCDSCMQELEESDG